MPQLQDLENPQVICDELVDFLASKSLPGPFKDKYAYLYAYMQQDYFPLEQFNRLSQEYREQVQDRLWTRYNRPFITRLIEQIKPDYFNKESEKESSTKSPQFIINNPVGQMSRILDKLPNDSLFTPQEIDAFLQNFLSFGDDYALAQTLNPLLSEVIDFKNQRLKQSFIDRHLGKHNYAKLLGGLSDEVIAKGFCDAIKVLFSNIITDIYKAHPLYMMYISQAGVRNSYSQSEDQSGIIKLYDNKKKYYFCQQMSEDIQKFASLGLYKNSRIDQQIINDELEHYSSSPKFKTLIENEENKQKVLAQLWFSALLNDLSSLRTKPEENAETVQKINSLIQKYNFYNYEKNLLSERSNLQFGFNASVVLTLLMVVAVVVTAIATFGTGAALLPFIPNMVALVVSASAAFIGFCSSIYYAWKGRTNGQELEMWDKAIHSQTKPVRIDSTAKMMDALPNAPAIDNALEAQGPNIESSQTSSANALEDEGSQIAPSKASSASSSSLNSQSEETLNPSSPRHGA